MLDGNFYSCLPGLFIFVSLTNNKSNSTRTWITVSMLYDWMCIYLLTPSKSYFQVSSIWMWKTGPMRLKIWNMCHWYGFYTLYFPMVCYRLKSLLFIYLDSYCIVVGPFLTSWFPYRSNSWRGVPCVSVVQSFPFSSFPQELLHEQQIRGPGLLRSSSSSSEMSNRPFSSICPILPGIGKKGKVRRVR